MKKAIINYSKSIWFKIMNDNLTRAEVIILALILLGISTVAVHASNGYLASNK